MNRSGSGDVRAAIVLVAVGLLLFALTRGLETLLALSVIALGVQVVVAINLHIHRRRCRGRSAQADEPFRFRTVEQAGITAAFAVAGVAALTGVWEASALAGWLALAAAALGASNVGFHIRERCRNR